MKRHNSLNCAICVQIYALQRNFSHRTPNLIFAIISSFSLTMAGLNVIQIMIDRLQGSIGLVAAVSTHKPSVLRVTCKLGYINMRILRTPHTLLKAIPHRCYPLGVVYTNKGFFNRSAGKIDSFRVMIQQNSPHI